MSVSSYIYLREKALELQSGLLLLELQRCFLLITPFLRCLDGACRGLVSSSSSSAPVVPAEATALSLVCFSELSQFS